MVSIWFLFGVGEFRVVKCSPAFAAISSNWIVPEVVDICAGAFEMTAGEFNLGPEARMRAKVKVNKRMFGCWTYLENDIRFMIAGGWISHHQNSPAPL